MNGWVMIITKEMWVSIMFHKVISMNGWVMIITKEMWMSIMFHISNKHEWVGYDYYKRNVDEHNVPYK